MWHDLEILYIFFLSTSDKVIQFNSIQPASVLTLWFNSDYEQLSYYQFNRNGSPCVVLQAIVFMQKFMLHKKFSQNLSTYVL